MFYIYNYNAQKSPQKIHFYLNYNINQGVLLIAKKNPKFKSVKFFLFSLVNSKKKSRWNLEDRFIFSAILKESEEDDYI